MGAEGVGLGEISLPLWGGERGHFAGGCNLW